MSENTNANSEQVNTGESYGGYGYRSFVLGSLLIAYIFNFIDRVIISYLQVDIEADIPMTNFQFGLLTGLAFATFYTFLGIIILGLWKKLLRISILLRIGLILINHLWNPFPENISQRKAWTLLLKRVIHT